MSWEAEYGGARQHHAEMEENKTALAVGAKVWRSHFGKVQEGEVIRITRVSYTKDGTATEYDDPNGKYTSYTARFENSFGGCESQTYQWRFFSRRGDACEKNAYELRRKADELRQELSKTEKLAAQMTAEDRDDPTPRSIAWARWHDGFFPTKRTSWTPADVDLAVTLYTEEFEHNHMAIRGEGVLRSFRDEVFESEAGFGMATEAIKRLAERYPAEAAALTERMAKDREYAERARLRREERERAKQAVPAPA